MVRHLALPTHSLSLYPLRKFTALRSLSFYHKSYCDWNDWNTLEDQLRSTKEDLEAQHMEIGSLVKQKPNLKCLLMLRCINYRTDETKVGQIFIISQGIAITPLTVPSVLGTNLY